MPENSDFATSSQEFLGASARWRVPLALSSLRLDQFLVEASAIASFSPSAQEEAALSLTLEGGVFDQELCQLQERGEEELLSTLLQGRSRSFFSKLIDRGYLYLNGKEAKKREIVREGDEVKLLLDPLLKQVPSKSLRPQKELPFLVIDEEEDFLILDKPAGMCVHPGAGRQEGTLVNALLGHRGDCFGLESSRENPWAVLGASIRPGIVHRLDIGTTGVMVVAKTPFCHAHLSAQFAQRSVEKEYLLLCAGALLEGTVEGFLGRDPKQRQRFVLHPKEEQTLGRYSKTHFTPLESLTPPYQLTRANIFTGRTHQIRVHAKARQAPLLGDPLYGNKRLDEETARRTGITPMRAMLHAERLAFDHPRSGKRLSFQAPMPEDMRQLHAALRIQ